MSSGFPYGYSCRLLAAAGCLLALLAGCTGSPDTGPAAPSAGSRFDGSYQGENRLLSGTDYMCGPPNYPQAIVVSRGVFVYPFPVNPPRTTPMPVQIAADGSIHGQMQYVVQDYTPRSNLRTVWVTVTGQVSDATFDAVATDERCRRRLLLQRH